MFHTYLAVAYLYVLWRFVMPLPVSGWKRALLAVFLLLVSQYHLILIGVYGTMFSPEFPRPLVLVAGWLFCTFVFILVFTLIVDLASVMLSLLCRSPVRRMFGVRARTMIASLSMALAAIGVHQAVQVPAVRQVQFTIKDLPPSLDGLKIVHLTDLHISRLFHADWVSEVVARSNALSPDVVLITGDLIDGTVEARSKDVAPLSGLRAPIGVIAVPGNHEYYFDGRAWAAEFRKLGMRVLTNQHAVLTKGLGSLVVAGTTDESAPTYGQEGPNLSRALEGVSPGAPVVLLKHRPMGAHQAAQAGVSLQLSGHTHGGMITGLGQLAKFANQGFVSGRYEVGNMHLYVSNGTALWNGFPIRLGVPSEITEIVLRAGSAF